MAAIVMYLKYRVERGNFSIKSHELENDGRRFVERVLGKTVNPSTISRKWRLLKRDVDDKSILVFPSEGDDGLFVSVKENKRSKKEGGWSIITINGTPVGAIFDAYEAQLKLF